MSGEIVDDTLRKRSSNAGCQHTECWGGTIRMLHCSPVWRMCDHSYGQIQGSKKSMQPPPMVSGMFLDLGDAPYEVEDCHYKQMTGGFPGKDIQDH